MLSREDQIRWKASKVAKAVLSTLPQGVTCRQSAQTLLDVATGEDDAYWPGHEQDLFSTPIRLFALAYHVGGQLKLWEQGEALQVLSTMPTLKDSLLILREKLLKDLVRTQNQVHYTGDEISSDKIDEDGCTRTVEERLTQVLADAKHYTSESSLYTIPKRKRRPPKKRAKVLHGHDEEEGPSSIASADASEEPGELQDYTTQELKELSWGKYGLPTREKNKWLSREELIHNLTKAIRDKDRVFEPARHGWKARIRQDYVEDDYPSASDDGEYPQDGDIPSRSDHRSKRAKQLEDGKSKG